LSHINLGFILKKLDRNTEALAEPRAGHELGSRQAHWQYPSADWVREAEQRVAIFGRLPALIRGEDHTKDKGDRLAVKQEAFFRRRPLLRRGAGGRREARRRPLGGPSLQRRLRRGAGRL
jgi:hypothetical protein